MGCTRYRWMPVCGDKNEIVRKEPISQAGSAQIRKDAFAKEKLKNYLSGRYEVFDLPAGYLARHGGSGIRQPS